MTAPFDNSNLYLIIAKYQLVVNSGPKRTKYLTMLFEDNKYTRWYYNIIDSAKLRKIPADQYTEKHHIIPKSLGGNNSKENLVKLTAREHFICHWLLTKMTRGVYQKKMAYACKRLMHSKNKKQDRYKINSRLYEVLKVNMNELLKDRAFTPEWRDKLQASAKKRASTEDAAAKEIRRNNMIKANKSRAGEKRPWMSGENNYFSGKNLSGELNHFYGKNHKEETLKKLRVPKIKIQCPHCNKVIGGQSNYQRWHGNNCKLFTGELKFPD